MTTPEAATTETAGAVGSSDVLDRGCNCLVTIREQLQEHHKSEINLELKMMLNTKTFTLRQGLPPLSYAYMDGKKRRKSYVTFQYCPFCGKRAI